MQTTDIVLTAVSDTWVPTLSAIHVQIRATLSYTQISSARMTNIVLRQKGLVSIKSQLNKCACKIIEAFPWALSSTDVLTEHPILLTCDNSSTGQLSMGPVTAHGMGILTETYVIYMERYASHRANGRCFGLALFPNLALCQPNCHPVNTARRF